MQKTYDYVVFLGPTIWFLSVWEYLLLCVLGLLFLYYWIVYIFFCVLGPRLLKICFSDIVEDISISNLTLFPLEIKHFRLHLKASRQSNSPPLLISFKQFTVLLNTKKIFYPLLDLLQVLPEEYYTLNDASLSDSTTGGFLAPTISVNISFLIAFNAEHEGCLDRMKRRRWLLRVEIQTFFISSPSIDFDFFIGPGSSSKGSSSTEASRSQMNQGSNEAERGPRISYAVLTKRLLQQILLFIEVEFSDGLSFDWTMPHFEDCQIGQSLALCLSYVKLTP